MLGKQLSAWTIAWFASALVLLLAALAALIAGAGGPGRWQGGTGLAAVHLAALGWLGQMMLGSLIQFVPVLAARPLVLPRLALPTLLLSTLGTLMLAAGFLGLEGWEPGLSLLAAAPLPLAAAFALAMAMLGATLVAARGWRDGSGRSVLAALAGLALAAASGGGMALALAGILPLGGLVAEGLPLHILLALGGWLGLAAFGVSYKLFAMFLLAPEAEGRPRRLTFAAAAAMLALALAGLAAVLAGKGAPVVLPLLPALAAAGLYLADIRQLWRTRRRRETEVNMSMSRVALAFLALTAALALPGALLGGAWAEAAVFCALAGWLSTLTLAQLVKIASFLTWIQVFSPRIGRAPVPMVHELTDAPAARRWLAVWGIGAAAGTLALLFGHATAFRLAAGLLLLAAAGLIRELVAIRRLTHLSPERRRLRPPMILPQTQPEPV